MAATRIVLAGIAVLSVALASLPADAQSSRDRGDRREQAEKREPLFPKATRDVEEGRVSSRMQRPINAMIEALNDDEDPAKALELAEGVLANERASAFERAIAAQVAGNASSELDDLDASMTYLKRVIEENALDNDAHYSAMQNLAISQLNNGQTQEAIATLTRLISETSTENADIHYALAGANLEAEQYAVGIAALEKAISLANPPKPEWAKLLVSAHLENDDPAAAAKAGEALLAQSPDDKRLIMTVASAYLDLEQQDKALALLEGARSRNLLTEARDYQTLYSLYFNADGREKDVIAVIQEGLSKGLLKRDVPTLGALAQAAYFAEDMAVAIETYKEAAALDPKGETGLNYAKVLSAEARDAEARDAAKAALAKGVAKPGEAWMVIARSENELDNPAAMRAALQEAAKHAETREQATKMLSQVR